MGGHRGFTLIEVMVAMLLGMVVMFAVSQVFLRNRESVKLLSNFSRMQENGRFGMDHITTLIRMAGYRADIGPSMTSAFPVVAGSFPAGAVIFADEGAGGTPDTLNLRYTGTTARPVPDCEGELHPKAAGATETVSISFSVVNGRLMCDSSIAGADPVELFENVQDFQLLFAQDEDGKNAGFPRRYLNAAATPANRWDEVVGVRVCLTMRSPDNNMTDAAQAYANCSNMLTRGTAVTTAPDRRLYKSYITTINLRNAGVI